MKKLWILLLVLSVFVTALAPAAAALPETSEGSGYIVKLKENAPADVRLFSSVNTEEIYEGAGLYRVESLNDVKRLGSAVEYYEENAVATLFALTNDKYAQYQWNLGSVSIDSAWNSNYDGSGIRIGVIDSGVNSMHEDFEGAIFEKGANMLDGSHDVNDQTGHGTFVAGTLAAVSNNNLGIAGLCDKAVIIPIKCFGNSIETDASYIVAAIYEAVDIYHCDVINMSLGVNRNLTSMRQAIEHANSKGTIVVSAVGNKGNAELNYPAAYPEVVGVGATTPYGSVASFSQKNESVFVTAPGMELVGLGIESEDSYVPKSRGQGTSYAVPHVVAAAVFLKQHNKAATVEDFKELLIQSVRDGGTPGYDTSYGYGTLDIRTFLAAMNGYEFNRIGEIFPDIDGHWAEDSIALCYSNGYFNGVSAHSFEPESLMSRAMFVTVLNRMSGETQNTYPNLFLDVPDGQYYTLACGWGMATGIVQGVNGTDFDPNGHVTREQMAVFLYRFATVYSLSEAFTDLTPLDVFSDASAISDYAREAMAWAVHSGIITGRTETSLVPGSNAKRAEVATMIDRFVQTFMIDAPEQ